MVVIHLNGIFKQSTEYWQKIGSAFHGQFYEYYKIKNSLSIYIVKILSKKKLQKIHLQKIFFQNWFYTTVQEYNILIFF